MMGLEASTVRRSVVVASALALLWVVSTPSGAIAGPAGCTILGTSGDDLALNGTSGDDVVCAKAGNDVANGLAGNDTVRGGAGNDTVQGGDGDDTVLGGPANDTVFGDPGADTLRGGPGDDHLLGSDLSADTLIDGGPGTDICVIDEGLDPPPTGCEIIIPF
jgi:Ca2+-binding RTX toxin-like protein